MVKLMKEFDYNLKDIFSGISSNRVDKKTDPKLEKCHNLEPFKEDYQLHEFIIDMDTDDYDWGNS